jgi:hypothetical protein
MGKIMTAAPNSRKLILLRRFYAAVTEALFEGETLT